MSDPRYYVIEGATATWHPTWEEATAHYLRAGGKAVITEVIPVTMAVVRAEPRRRSATEMYTRAGTRSDTASNLLLAGETPQQVMAETGLTRQAIYNLRGRLVKRGLLRPLREVRP